MGQGETISDTELALMQAESRDRHSIPVKKKRNRRSGLTYKKRVDRAAHDPIPDLMAEMIANAPKIAPVEAVQTATAPIAEQPQEVTARKMPPTIKKEKLMSYTKQIPLHTPNPATRKISRVPIWEEKPKPIVRPKAEYDNHKDSRFPIYNELAKEMLKKSG